MELFFHYSWPGNIRELQNVLEHAMNYAHGDTILMSHVESYFHDAPSAKPTDSSLLHEVAKPVNPLLSTLSDTEYKTILKALEACGGDKSAAAKQLGIARSTFYRKLNKYGL